MAKSPQSEAWCVSYRQVWVGPNSPPAKTGGAVLEVMGFLWVGSGGYNLVLVGGFNPFEKYARQIGSFPQVGMKIKIFETTT